MMMIIAAVSFITPSAVVNRVSHFRYNSIVGGIVQPKRSMELRLGEIQKVVRCGG